MRYLGGKSRLAKHIVPIMLKDRKPGQYFYDLFTGGGSIVCAVDGNRVANDTHYHLIKMWQAVQRGWIPPETITEEQHKAIKNHPGRYPPYLVAYVGFGCSFGGVYFSGFTKNYVDNRNGKTYDATYTSYKALIKKAQTLKGVQFTNLDYRQVPIFQPSIIYCDPPYENTGEYRGQTGFNHDEFWQWVREMSQRHKVFVSEYQAPDDFQVIWEKRHTVNINNASPAKTQIERLFIHETNLQP